MGGMALDDGSNGRAVPPTICKTQNTTKVFKGSNRLGKGLGGVIYGHPRGDFTGHGFEIEPIISQYYF